jgi:hypothetical protein
MQALAGVQLMKYALVILLLASCCSAQTVLLSFDGDTGAGTFNHPNDSMAANGTYVAETGQQGLVVDDYTGARQLTIDMTTFITNAGLTAGKILDPRIIYDTFISRWIIVCSCAADFFMVSSGSNIVTSTWKGVNLSTATGDLSMRLGFDKNWVYVTEFYAPTTRQSEFAIPQADVAWSGAGNVSLTHLIVSNSATLDSYPEIDLNPAKGLTAPAYFVSRQNESQGGSNTAFSLAIDTFTPSSATAGVFSNPTSPTLVATGFVYNSPVNTNQPTAPPISSNESHRPFEVFIGSDNQLNVVFGSGPCSTSCPGAQGTDTQQLAFWFQVAIPALTLTQKAKMSNSSLGFLFPSLAVDSSGNVNIVVSGASTSQSASIYGFYHLTTDALGVLHGPNLLRAGTGTYSCAGQTPSNWGTYSFAVQEPTDGTKLWAIQEYSNSATLCNWFTRFIQMQMAAIPPGIAPTGNFNGVIVGGASR